MRVGIWGEGFITWGGGVDLLRMLVGSLVAADPDVDLHVLLPVRGPRVALEWVVQQVRLAVGRGLLGRAAPSRQFVQGAFDDMIGRVHVHSIDTGDAALRRAVSRLHLNVVLPAIRPPAIEPGCPWIGYVFDFQHRHLPDLFTDQDRAHRDALFGEMAQQSRTLIVNARAVARDMATFLPGSPSRVVALPFCAAPKPQWFSYDTADAQQRHGTGQRYFMVCNQFWRHKDYETAIRAFATVATGRPDVLLVCTGSTVDYRAPTHFADLMMLAESLGVRQRLLVLGLIPKQDQIALMKGAIALIQPTLFEGGPGGGAVYDAVSLDVPCIVSDIDVNLELEEPVVVHFRTRDADDLARRMLNAPLRVPTSTAARERLLQRGHDRAARCGRVLFEAIHELTH